jgi:hypothetical protein
MPRSSELELDMKVEELVESKVWIKMAQFRGVPGSIETMSNTVDINYIKSSVSQSTFRIKMASGNVIEVLGSNISKIEHCGHAVSCSV